MRRTLKLLLLLGIGLVMTRHHGGDPGDPTPATPDGDGADTRKTKTPDGVDAVTDWGGAKEVVTKQLDEGEAKDADGDGTPDVTPATSGWTDAQTANMPNLGDTSKRENHILYGEYGPGNELIGGGHGPGGGGETEFTDRWEDPEIMANIQDVARNPTSVPKERDGGGWEVTGWRDGVNILVVMNKDGTVWTAYPLEGDGVVYND